LEFDTSTADYHVQVDAVCLLSLEEDHVHPEPGDVGDSSGDFSALFKYLRNEIDYMGLDFDPSLVILNFAHFMALEYPVFLARREKLWADGSAALKKVETLKVEFNRTVLFPLVQNSYNVATISSNV
jgi:hypothetical protein